MRLCIQIAAIATMLVGYLILHGIIVAMDFRPYKLSAFFLSNFGVTVDMMCSIFTCCGAYTFTKSSAERRLKYMLPDHLHGQPVALATIQDTIINNFDNFTRGVPISLHLSGPRGTGKSHACSLIAACLYSSGVDTEIVHKIRGDDLNTKGNELEFYQDNLKSWIHGNLTRCNHSMFIFEDTEKMPPKFLEIINPFLRAKLGGIFLFTTSKVNPKIIEKYKLLRDVGAEKSAYPIYEFKEFDEALYYTTDKEYKMNITGNAIFLPLNLNDLQYCMFDELWRLGRFEPTNCIIGKIYNILEIIGHEEEALSCKVMKEITRWVVKHSEC